MSSDPNFTARFDSDLDLVRCAQRGNSDAFASLFHAHKARIYSVCLRITNNPEEPGSDWRPCSASFTDTEAECGLRESSDREQHFTLFLKRPGMGAGHWGGPHEG
jgi:hypothetical protein